MRVVFAGTPEFAAAALAALHAAGFEIPLVLTQPDRPAGRGLQLQPSAVKRLALDLGLPLAQPRSLRQDGKFADAAAAARQALDSAAPDVIVVAAYGLILPEWVLTLPRLGCLNIHASLLPRWRGAAPIQRAIEAGDAATGITIMQMDAGLDTGAMLLEQGTPIGPDDSSATLHQRLAAIGATLIVQALHRLEAGDLAPRPQPAEGVTYAHKIDKAEAVIDWAEPAAVIERRVRAFDPAPGMSFTWAGEPVKVWRARVQAGQAAPGAVVEIGDGRVAVACGAGLLEPLLVQRPGGRRIAAVQYLHSGPGLTLRAGRVLGWAAP
jgi:methionyl-tRNA formyltransferase